MCLFICVLFVSAFVPALTTVPSVKTSSKSPDRQTCVLPGYPENGSYIAVGQQTARPGQNFENIALNYTCNENYEVVGRGTIFCVSGVWSDPPPECTRFCKLEQNSAVAYSCTTANGEGRRACEEHVPSGTVVQVSCNASNYYSKEPLPAMTCVDGQWNYVPTCQPECGTITPEAVPLIAGGSSPLKGSLPWHATIYSKMTKPYMHICEGVLISSNLVLSAAHCFWDELSKSKKPKEEYAVALGKKFRPWDDVQDSQSQKFDIKDIHIPAVFLGRDANYQSDIAVLVLERPAAYTPDIKPVCLNFDGAFENNQLSNGRLAKSGGWLMKTSGKPSQVFDVVSLPYMDIAECINQSPQNFRPFITSDKMCAVPVAGVPLCKGNTGAGLVFPHVEQGRERYYLRGLLAGAPQTPDDSCDHTIKTFTRIGAHEEFIKKYS